MDGDKMTDYARIDNLSEQVISFLLHEEEGYTVDEDGYILNADGCRIPREKVDYATYESLSQKEREFVDDFSYYQTSESGVILDAEGPVLQKHFDIEAVLDDRLEGAMNESSLDQIGHYFRYYTGQDVSDRIRKRLEEVREFRRTNTLLYHISAWDIWRITENRDWLRKHRPGLPGDDVRRGEDRIVVWQMKNRHRHAFLTNCLDWRQECETIPPGAWHFRDGREVRTEGDFFEYIREDEGTDVEFIDEIPFTEAGLTKSLKEGYIDIMGADRPLLTLASLQDIHHDYDCEEAIADAVRRGEIVIPHSDSPLIALARFMGIDTL